jgi:hypothetical protein
MSAWSHPTGDLLWLLETYPFGQLRSSQQIPTRSGDACCPTTLDHSNAGRSESRVVKSKPPIEAIKSRCNGGGRSCFSKRIVIGGEDVSWGWSGPAIDPQGLCLLIFAAAIDPVRTGL